MLTIWRRHLKDCPHTSRRYRRCKCPIWVQGTLKGEKVRKSLDLNSWEAGAELVHKWETAGEIGAVKPESPRCDDAVDDFLKDCEARHLSPVTVRKQKLLLEKQLLPFLAERGITRIRQVSLDVARDFRASWTDSSITCLKKLERLRGFFRFCVQSGWMKTNPASGIKPPKVDNSPTLPFTDEQVRLILEACDRFPIKGIYGAGNRRRMKAMVLLLLNTGLRIGDAVGIKKSSVEEGRMFLRTAKTGSTVHLPIPADCVDALKAVPEVSVEYVFWTGKGLLKSAVSDWQRSFRMLFRLANVPDGHPHRFRDTVATRLLVRGVSVENVAAILGNSPKIVLKHYAPWVVARQTALDEAVKGTWS